MLARVISISVVLGLANLASLGIAPLSAAQAAYPSWSAYSSPSKRPQFRPWNRREAAVTVGRWRPQQVAGQARSRTSAVRPRTVAVFASESRYGRATPAAAGMRSVGPSRPAQHLGVRFRPDDRQSLYGPVGNPPGGTSEPGQSELQSQFRPAPYRRKPAYEEMQRATPRYRQVYASGYMPYPGTGAAPPAVYGGYWPTW